MLLKEMVNLSGDERKELGKRINETKNLIKDRIDEAALNIKENIKKERIKKESIDISLPGKKQNHGSLHPITKTVLEIKSIVSEMGFDISDGPEVELVKYNFDALNIPKTHPSREKNRYFLYYR